MTDTKREDSSIDIDEANKDKFEFACGALSGVLFLMLVGSTLSIF